MKAKVIAAIVLLFLSGNLYSQTKTAPGNTIPFVTYQINKSQSYSGAYISNEASSSMSLTSAAASIRDIPVKDLQKFVLEIREAICGGIGNADFRVWVFVGADAKGDIKIISVSGSAQTGLEIIVHCNSSSKK